MVVGNELLDKAWVPLVWMPHRSDRVAGKQSDTVSTQPKSTHTHLEATFSGTTVRHPKPGGSYGEAQYQATQPKSWQFAAATPSLNTVVSPHTGSVLLVKQWVPPPLSGHCLSSLATSYDSGSLAVLTLCRPYSAQLRLSAIPGFSLGMRHPFHSQQKSGIISQSFSLCQC